MDEHDDRAQREDKEEEMEEETTHIEASHDGPSADGRKDGETI